MMSTPPLRVLIVEDDAAIHEEIKVLMTDLGFVVAGDAYNGEQAIALTQQLKPDVILLDIVMPDPDSGKEDNRAGFYTTAQILRENPTPIVWLTAYETPQMVADASELGVTAYLLKPPKADEIARTLTLAHARFADLQALRQLNIKLHNEITERKAAEAARQRMEDALKAANAELSERLQQVEHLQSALREQAIRDPLTNLYNRRYLNDMMVREIARAEREHLPLSVVIADVDHFKAINDRYGHQVGDLCLVEMAKLLSKNVRNSDIVCRYGGEEFLLIFPDVGIDMALKLAESIRLQCNAMNINLPDGTVLQLTLSLGVASYPLHGVKAKSLISKADQALYAAKRTGRNRVVGYAER